MQKTAITRADIMALEDYLQIRKDRRREMAAVKKARSMEVGPFCTFYFESYETMLHQVHEMLAIEKGGEAQIPDELEAYNPLVPQGKDELLQIRRLVLEAFAVKAGDDAAVNWGPLFV